MHLLKLFSNPSNLIIQENLKILLDSNLYSKPFGLYLTREKALEVLEDRNDTLNRYGRIEIDCQIIQKIITAFADSPYIQQSDYANTLMSLLEIFHYLKNELEDSISDDDLIEFMSEAFNGPCDGDLDLLAEKEAYQFIQKYRQGFWYED